MIPSLPFMQARRSFYSAGATSTSVSAASVPSYFSPEYEGPLDYVPEAAPGLAENTL